MPRTTPLRAVAVETEVETVKDDLNMEDEYVAGEGSFNSDTFDLDAVGFDDLRDEVEKRKLTAPSGDWIKKEPWDFSVEKNVSVIVDDNQDGDINPLGRTMYLMYGYPETRVDREGNEFTPFLRIRMSPDRRMHREKEEQVDFAYKMFLAAKDVFVAINGRKAKTQGELLRCLAEESYALNTMNGDDGLFVLRVKPLKKQRP